MEKHTKTVKLVGGPLDGQTREVKSDQKVFLHEQPAASEDIIGGEVPVGFFPPMHEYVYEEDSSNAGTFVFRAQHHQ